MEREWGSDPLHSIERQQSHIAQAVRMKFRGRLYTIMLQFLFEYAGKNYTAFTRQAI